MAINTKRVPNRRTLRFQTVEDVLAEAERLAATPHRCLGNWSAGQIFMHLALTMNNSVNGVPFRAPWFVRVMMGFARRRFLSNPMSPGFQMPDYMAKHFSPADVVSLEEGLAALRAATQRYQSAPTLAPSPAFGEMSRAEYDQLHARHGEMHLSFLVAETT